MASPHVAGVAALLYANGTASDAESVFNVLTSTALDLAWILCGRRRLRRHE